MGDNSLVIILLAIAIGGVAGFEVGQHLAKKQFKQMIERVMAIIQKQTEAEKAEKKKQLEHIQNSAKKIGDWWENLLKEAAKAKEERSIPISRELEEYAQREEASQGEQIEMDLREIEEKTKKEQK